MYFKNWDSITTTGTYDNWKRFLDDNDSSWVVVRDKGVHHVVCEALGVNPDNIKVDVKSDISASDPITYICVNGETENKITGTTYKIHLNHISCNKNNITHIDWKAENGLVYIDVYYKDETKDIKINKI